MFLIPLIHILKDDHKQNFEPFFISYFLKYHKNWHS